MDVNASNDSTATTVVMEHAFDETLRDVVRRCSPALPYVRQSFSWDCGLACVEMALSSRGLRNVRFPWHITLDKAPLR